MSESTLSFASSELFRKQLLVRSVNTNAFLKITDIAAAKAALAKP